MAVKQGDRVKLRYVGKFEDDAVFDKGVTEFEIGEGFIVKGLEEGVIGMKKGEKKRLTLPPKKAFGERREGFKKAFPKSDLRGREVKEGDPLRVRTSSGRVAPCVVEKLTKDEVIVDLNHPLAGQTLRFEIEVIEVR